MTSQKDFPIDCIVSFYVFTGKQTEPKIELFGEVVGYAIDPWTQEEVAVIKTEGERYTRNLPFRWLKRQKD